MAFSLRWRDIQGEERNFKKELSSTSSLPRFGKTSVALSCLLFQQLKLITKPLILEREERILA